MTSSLTYEVWKTEAQKFLLKTSFSSKTAQVFFQFGRLKLIQIPISFLDFRKAVQIGVKKQIISCLTLVWLSFLFENFEVGRIFYFIVTLKECQTRVIQEIICFFTPIWTAFLKSRWEIGIWMSFKRPKWKKAWTVFEEKEDLSRNFCASVFRTSISERWGQIF